MIIRQPVVYIVSPVSILRKAYSAYLLVGFFALLLLPLAFEVSNSASGQQNNTVMYYLNVDGVIPTSTCSTSQNILGSLDSNSPAADSASLNDNAGAWNTFCTYVPVAIATPLTISSVKLTLYVCCGDRARYALLPQLIDNSTSPPTILASSEDSTNSPASGASCQSATKIALDIPVNNGAMLTSGQVLVLQFQFAGPHNVILCTGSGGFLSLSQNTPSSIAITGTAPVTTTTSSTTQDVTSSASTSTTTTSQAHSSVTSASHKTTTSINTIQTSATSTDTSSPPHPTSADSLPTTTYFLPKTSQTQSSWLNTNDPLLLSGLIAGLAVIVSSVIALGGRKS